MILERVNIVYVVKDVKVKVKGIDFEEKLFGKVLNALERVKNSLSYCTQQEFDIARSYYDYSLKNVMNNVKVDIFYKRYFY